MDFLSKPEYDIYVKNRENISDITFNHKIRLFNWFIVRDRKINYLVCKCKNIENDEYYYLYFNNYEYFECLDNELQEIEEYQELKNKIDENKYLGKYFILENQKELKINNVDSLISFDSFLKDRYKKKLNITNDIYIFQYLPVVKINARKSIIFQAFKQRWFYVLNNINLSGSYNVNAKVSNFLFDNSNNSYKDEKHYFIKDEDIKNFFNNLITTDTTNVTKLSFDIECETNGSFPKSEKNPITHIGIVVNNNKNSNLNRCFCLIATDIDKKNPYFQTKEIDEIDDCKYYNYKEINDTLIDKIYDDNVMFKFMSEYNLLLFTKKLLEDTKFDYIITYNGNDFDIPYINGRLRFYNLDEIISRNLLNNNNLKIQDRKLNYSGKSTSYKILRNFNSIVYFDMYNHVKTNYTIDSYSLNFFSQMRFKNNMNIKKISLEEYSSYQWNQNINIYKIYPLSESREKKYTSLKDVPSNLLLFYKILRTANYCFINNKSYIIINKKKIISSSKDLYKEDSILESINQEFYIYPHKTSDLTDEEQIKTVCLSKDAIEIFNKDTYKDYTVKNSIIYAKYCIHDSILPNYLFDCESIHYKITANASSYFISQSESFIYKNSSNCLGLILNELLLTKSYIRKVQGLNFGEFIGGKVFEPKKKYNDNPIYSFDFQSLYPNIIILHNISPETIEMILYSDNPFEFTFIRQKIKEKFNHLEYDSCEIKSEINNAILFIVFDKKQIGFIPNIVSKGLKKRLEYKRLMKSDPENYILYNTMQQKEKEGINSIYGLLGSQYFPYNCKFCALAIPSYGRDNLKFLHHIINNSLIKDGYWYPNVTEHILSGKKVENVYSLVSEDSKELSNLIEGKTFRLEVIYGDTDSTMISIDSENIRTTALMGKKLSKVFNESILFNTILLELENIYINMIICKKKKYRCYKIDVDDIKYIKNEEDIEKYSMILDKGTSLVRRDYTSMHKNKMIDLLKYLNTLMTEKNMNNIDNNIFEFVNKAIDEELMKCWNNISSQENLLHDFVLSMEYKTVKTQDYYINNKIKEFNADPLNMNKINIGDRFYYIYIVNYVPNENTSNVLEKLNWNKKNLLDVHDKLYIIDFENFHIPPNTRIALEIYLSRFISDVKNYLISENKIYSIEKLYF